MPEGKVIRALDHRREIESALQALGRVRTEEENRPYLLALAGYGLDVLPVLLQFLETPDPWMVRALGRVVTQMEDRPRVTEALRRAILAAESSDRRRIVAMVLLDQFLQQPLDEALFTALGNPTDMAVRALLQEAPGKAGTVRLDYLSIIHAQPGQEVLYALEQFRQEGSDLAVEALRFFALDEREEIARPALEALGSIRRPASLGALRVAEPNVPSHRRPLVERMRRKLLLSGVAEACLPGLPAGSRVLVSPLDGAGHRLILFLFPHEAHCRGLHLFLDDERGIHGAYEALLGEGEYPPLAPAGAVHSAPHPWEGICLLEGTFPYARSLLREALSRNESQETAGPLEYRFFCDQVWGWSVPEEVVPSLPASNGKPSQQTMATLLGHSCLLSWFLESEAICQAARGLLNIGLSSPAGQGALALTTISLIQSEFPAALCQRYAVRLRDTVEWLTRAGEKELAAAALAAAEELAGGQPLHSIFAMMLLQKGLLIALGNLRQERNLNGPPGPDGLSQASEDTR